MFVRITVLNEKNNAATIDIVENVTMVRLEKTQKPDRESIANVSGHEKIVRVHYEDTLDFWTGVLVAATQCIHILIGMPAKIELLPEPVTTTVCEDVR